MIFTKDKAAGDKKSSPKAERDAPRKGGDRRNGSKMASTPPPAGVSKTSEPASPVTKGRGRPAGSAYPGRVPVLIKFDPEAVAWLDAEYVRRKQPSRVDLIRALVDEARGA